MLWLASAFMAGTAIALPGAAIWLPYANPPHLASPVSTNHEPGSLSENPTVTLKDVRTLLGKNLRSPLMDSAEALPDRDDAQPRATTRARPSIRLLGYAVENEHSVAILGGSDGTTQLLGVDEVIDDAIVRRIDADGVTLEFKGDRFSLRFDESPVEVPIIASPVPQPTRRIEASMFGYGRYR